MSDRKIYEDSKNYTAQVVKLPAKQKLKGLDNLVGVSIMGKLCLIQANYPEDQPYLFFESGTKLSDAYCKNNDLYRHSDLNNNPESKNGYLDDNGRVKSVKFKGHLSTGIVMPLSSLNFLWGPEGYWEKISIGDEFNEIAGQEICRKYIVPSRNPAAPGTKVPKVLEEIIDDKYFPEHKETAHFLKFVDNINIRDMVTITEKLHGTSARTAYTLVKRKLNWLERIAQKLGVQVVEEEYKYVVGSRRCIKSIGFEGLKNKNHYYPTDLWTTTAKQLFEGKLYKGEAVYYEIIGLEPDNGGAIQKGYSYGLSYPNVYVYRITNINPQGIEVDLTWEQLQTRCIEIGVPTVPVLEHDVLSTITGAFSAEVWVQSEYGNTTSTLDGKTLMEGVCIRFEGYPHPKVYKYKSPLFLLHESKQADEGVEDAETCN